MKTCTYCGAQVADDSKFCTFCGSAFAAAETTQPQPVEVQAEVVEDSYQPPSYGNVTEQQPPEPPFGQQPQQQYQPPQQQQVYGNAADQQPYQQAYQQPNQQQYQQPYNQQPTFAAPTQQGAVVDSGSIGWGILGFIIPIVGIVLYFVWRNTKPKSGQVALIGALISIGLNIIFMVMGGGLN